MYDGRHLADRLGLGQDPAVDLVDRVGPAGLSAGHVDPGQVPRIAAAQEAECTRIGLFELAAVPLVRPERLINGVAHDSEDGRQ